MQIRHLLLIGLIMGYLCIGLADHVLAEIHCDKWSKQYHDEGCEKIKDITKRNYLIFRTEPEAESRGYYPCQTCLPPVSKSVEQSNTRQYRSMPIKKVSGYIGDGESKICHQSWCDLVKSIKSTNVVKFSKVEDAWVKKYQPCQECYPPVKPKKKNAMEEDEQASEAASDFIEPKTE